MEQEFDDNFERFLRTGADEYRMYPSERVWTGIYDRLHGKKKMFAVAFAALALIALLFVYRDHKEAAAAMADGNQKPAATTQNQPAPAPLTPARTTPPNNARAVQIFTPVRPEPIDAPAATETGFAENPAEMTAASFEGNFTRNQELNAAEDIMMPEKNRTAAVEPPKITVNNNLIGQGMATELREPAPNPEALLLAGNAHEDRPSVKKQEPLATMAVAKPQPARKQQRVMTQFYITPSISYRSLYDTRSDRATGDSGNLDKAIFHKPGVGLEAGVSWLKQIDNRLRFKAGVQLNFNQYNIKATITQRASAPIDLTGDSRDLTISSRYENRSDGVYPEWLENKNLQISLPVGIEFVVTGNNRAQLNIGTTLQPSYLIQDKSYLLSTDLKRYASTNDLKQANKQDFLVRRLNLNAGIETFFTFSTANSRWHIGPQLRYQLFSSYNKVYPFKENLFDYGFKIGFSKIIR